MDEGVEAAEVVDGGDQVAPVGLVGDVAGEGPTVVTSGQLAGRGPEGGPAPGVDHERPSVGGEGPGEGQAQAPGGAGDEGDGLVAVVGCHAPTMTDGQPRPHRAEDRFPPRPKVLDESRTGRIAAGQKGCRSLVDAHGTVSLGGIPGRSDSGSYQSFRARQEFSPWRTTRVTRSPAAVPTALDRTSTRVAEPTPDTVTPLDVPPEATDEGKEKRDSVSRQLGS